MKVNSITKLAEKAKLAQQCEEPSLFGKVSKVSQRNYVKVSEKNYVKISGIFESDAISTFTKRNVGRPTSFRKDYIKQAYRLCLLGATDKDLADFFGVTEQTINNWKKNHSEFFESINRGKRIMDAKVAESLYMLAIGYSHPAVYVSNYRGKITITEIVKHYPPNVTACIFWLRNRQPKLWGSKFEPELQQNLNKFPPKEELDTIYKKALAEAAERNATLLKKRQERLGIRIDDGDATDPAIKNVY